MDINVILHLDDDCAHTEPATEIQFPYINHITCTYTLVRSNFNVSQSMLEERETGETGGTFSVIWHTFNRTDSCGTLYQYWIISILSIFRSTQIQIHDKNNRLIWNISAWMCLKSIIKTVKRQKLRSLFWTQHLVHFVFSVTYSGWAFSGCSRMGTGSLPKVYYTYPTIVKVGTVPPHLKNTQKMYESRDTPLLLFCWHQHFFTKNQQILLYQGVSM